MWETLYHAAIQKFTSTTLVALLTSLTVATSGMAGYKLVQTAQQSSPTEAAVQLRTAPAATQDGLDTSASDILPSGQTGGPNTTPTAAPSAQPVAKKPVALPTAMPSASALPKASAAPSAQASAGPASCIIMVSGKTYDVQPLRNSHPGGNIFVCDSDMTSAYQNAHGSSLSKLSGYETTAQLGQSSTGSSNSGSSTAGSSLKNDDDDEDEDEHENRFSDDDHEDGEDENEDEDED